MMLQHLEHDLGLICYHYSLEQLLQSRVVISSYSGFLSSSLERVATTVEQSEIGFATTFQDSNLCGGGF